MIFKYSTYPLKLHAKFIDYKYGLKKETTLFCYVVKDAQFNIIVKYEL